MKTYLKVIGIALVLAVAALIATPAVASDDQIGISPVSGHWNYPEAFELTNNGDTPVTINWLLDCWDETICKDTSGTVTLAPGEEGEPGESAIFGLGNICSKWQLDLDWDGGSWGGIAEKNPNCGKPPCTHTTTTTTCLPEDPQEVECLVPLADAIASVKLDTKKVAFKQLAWDNIHFTNGELMASEPLLTVVLVNGEEIHLKVTPNISYGYSKGCYIEWSSTWAAGFTPERGSITFPVVVESTTPCITVKKVVVEEEVAS